MTTRRALLLAAAGLGGCRSVPLIEVAEIRFAVPEVGLPERAAQVRRAAAGLGWTAEDVAPGRVRTTLDAAGRRVVDVAFDRQAFSVRHEARGGRVEPAYNVEVARLRDAIVAQSGF